MIQQILINLSYGFLALIVLFILWFIYASILLYINYRKVSHIPGYFQYLFAPFRIPLLAPRLYLGNFEGIHQAMKEFSDGNGVLRMSFFKGNTIITTNKNILKEFFVTKQSSFEKPDFIYNMFNLFGENVLSAPNSESWKRHHKVAHPAFSIDNLQYMCEEAVYCTDLLVERWMNRYNSNSFELKNDQVGEAMSMVTVEVLGKAGLKVSFGVFNKEDSFAEEFKHAVNLVISKGLLIQRFLSHNETLYKLTQKIFGVDKAINIVNQVLDKSIADRKKELENDFDNFSKKDILSLLVKANAEEKTLTDMELKSNSLIFLLAGEETTSSSLQWILYELAKHPDYQKRAREEINTLLPNRAKPNYETVQSLLFTTSIILEALRLHPPVFSIAKEAVKNVKLGDYEIPKNTLVSIFIYGVHRNKEYWKDPDEFQPDRFMDMELRNKCQHDFTFVSFAMGQRKCIGFQFAQLEACMILVRLLQHFEFTLLNNESLEEDKVRALKNVTIRPANLKLLIKPITSTQ